MNRHFTRNRSENVKPFRRFLSRAIVASLSGAALVAASASGTTSLPVASASTTSLPSPSSLCPSGHHITLTLWSHYGGYITFLNWAAQRWTKQYAPNCHLTVTGTVFPGVWTKEVTAMSSGLQLPNFLDLEISAFPLFMHPGLLASHLVNFKQYLSPTVLRDLVKEKPYTYQGGVYGLETALSPVGYYYQPRIFTRYGIKLPITTWSQFYSDGLLLAKHGIAMAPACLDLGCNVFYDLYLEDGGTIFNPSGQLVIANSSNRKVLVNVLDYLRSAIQKGIFNTTLTGTTFFSGTIPYQLYESGKIAGVLAPDWYAFYNLVPDAKQMSGEWRVSPMPRWPGSPYTTATWGGTAIGVSAKTPNWELAVAIDKYALATTPGQIHEWKTIGFYPTYLPAMSSPIVTSEKFGYFGGEQLGAVWRETTKNVATAYQSSLLPQFDTDLSTVIDALYTLKAPVPKTVASIKAIQTKLNQTLGP